MLHEDGAICEAAESVLRQAYPNWQLCIGIDGADASRRRSAMRTLERDLRVRQVLAPDDAAFAATLSAATGDYIAILEENAMLSPLALYRIVEALQANEYSLIYSDEDFLDRVLGRVDPLFKPNWSPDLLGADVYPGNLFVHKRGDFGIPNGAFNLNDYRQSLAAVAKEQSLRVHHIPKILYHSRATATWRRVSPFSRVPGCLCRARHELILGSKYHRDRLFQIGGSTGTMSCIDPCDGKGYDPSGCSRRP